jgi:hypothetical protein
MSRIRKTLKDYGKGGLHGIILLFTCSFVYLSQLSVPSLAASIIVYFNISKISGFFTCYCVISYFSFPLLLDTYLLIHTVKVRGLCCSGVFVNSSVLFSLNVKEMRLSLQSKSGAKFSQER